MDIAAWLRELGLERYEQAFRQNAIDWDVLPELTESDLETLGLPLGPRTKLLKAIAGLPAEATAVSLEDAPSPRPVSREAERRQLTVLFCDLVGSTELAARLDPEDLREVMGTYHRCAAHVVERFEGHIVKYLGDGVVVYFGWPRAHEDDAERAVRAGLALVEAVPEVHAGNGLTLLARVGIATGLVVVSRLIGEGGAQEETLVGDAPNLAARLQALAEPGSVVVSQATRRLVGGLFELADLGPRRLKGFAEPLPAWRVEGQGCAEGRFEALHGERLTPLVGREQELALLLERWERAKEGEGHVVLLASEPGIGKSRLVRALRERLGGEPHAHLGYEGSPYYQTSPLHPVVGQLERAAGFVRADTTGAKLGKLEALLVRSNVAIAEAAPLLAALLSIPAGDRYSLLGLSPERQKARTLEVLVERIAGLAAQRPLLVVLEDAHWGDPTTFELFGLTIGRVQRLPVLVVITFRPEFQPPWLGRRHVTMLTLSRLSRRQSAAMVERITGKMLPPDVVGQIVAKTDGVPLFIEELTKAVVESGLLREEADRYALAGPLPPLAIPPTLQDSLIARLDRLELVKEVARVAACLGREFPHQLLAAVARLPETELTPALDRLVETELLFRQGVPPEASYTFKHALIRDAAYASILKSHRRQYHARIGSVLKERFPETAQTQPELLAQHFAEAGLIEEAIDHWHEASQRAIARSAMEEATTQAAKGLELLESLAPGPGRLRRELNLQLALASALNATAGHGTREVGEAYARAVELANQLEDTSRLFPALDGLITCHFSRAELAMAGKLAEQFLNLAERTGDVVPQLIALSEVGIVRLAIGDLEGARQSLEGALGLYDPARHGSLCLIYSFDPQVICLGYLSWTLFSLGYPTHALRFSRQSIVEARRSSHPMTLAFALGRSAAVLHMCRNWQELEAIVTELMALGVEREFRNYQVVGRFYLGSAQVRSGRSDEGLELLREALTDMRAGGDEDWFPLSLSLLAEAHHKAGQIGEGLELLDEASDRVESEGERWFAAEVHRLRGELLLSLFDPTEAEKCFVQAARVAQEQNAKMWELRAATSLARLWRDQHRRGEARALLAPVYDWFTEGFDTVDLKDAKALLDELA